MLTHIPPGKERLNENGNGLLRYYFPKRTDFSKVTNEELANAVWELNNRPRKLLQYKTAQEVFDEHLNLPQVLRSLLEYGT